MGHDLVVGATGGHGGHGQQQHLAGQHVVVVGDVVDIPDPGVLLPDRLLQP